MQSILFNSIAFDLDFLFKLKNKVKLPLFGRFLT